MKKQRIITIAFTIMLALGLSMTIAPFNAPPAHAAVAVAAANFAFAGNAKIASVDGQGNVQLELNQVTLYRTSDQSVVTIDVTTAYFVPSLANARTAMTDALVNAWVAQYGGSLTRSSAVVPTFQAGL
jgi:hypothetical protein